MSNRKAIKKPNKNLKSSPKTASSSSEKKTISNGNAKVRRKTKLPATRPTRGRPRKDRLNNNVKTNNNDKKVVNRKAKISANKSILSDASKNKKGESSKKMATKQTSNVSKKKVTKTNAATSKKDNKVGNQNKSTKKTNFKNKIIKAKNATDKTKFYSKKSHRLASLNASAKVKLLSEIGKHKPDIKEQKSKVDNEKKAISLPPSLPSTSKMISTVAIDKTSQSSNLKKSSGNSTKKDNLNKNKIAQMKKKKLAQNKNADPEVELIDTRRYKRMANLNASAILSATYSVEKEKRNATNESKPNIKQDDSETDDQVDQMSSSSSVEKNSRKTPKKTIDNKNNVETNSSNLASSSKSVNLAKETPKNKRKRSSNNSTANQSAFTPCVNSIPLILATASPNVSVTSNNANTIIISHQNTTADDSPINLSVSKCKIERKKRIKTNHQPNSNTNSIQTNPVNSSINESNQNCLPKGVTNLRKATGLPVSNTTVSSSAVSSIQNLGNNLIPYNSTPLHLIPVATNYSPFNIGHNNYIYSNQSTPIPGYHNASVSSIYQSTMTIATNPLSTFPLLLSNSMQQNVGNSYLSQTATNSFYPSTNSVNCINLLGNGPQSRFVNYRPLAFQTQSTHTATTFITTTNNTINSNLFTPNFSSISSVPQLSINLNEQNLFNCSFLRQSPVNLPVNSFTQPTFLLQTPIVNSNNISFTPNSACSTISTLTRNRNNNSNGVLQGRNRSFNLTSSNNYKTDRIVNNATIEMENNYLTKLFNTKKTNLNLKRRKNNSVKNNRHSMSLELDVNKNDRINANNNPLMDKLITIAAPITSTTITTTTTTAATTIQNGHAKRKTILLLQNGDSNRKRNKISKNKTELNTSPNTEPINDDGQSDNKKISLKNGPNRKRNLLNKLNNLSPTDNDCESTPTSSNELMPRASIMNDSILTFNKKKNRRPIVHGWSWEGKPVQKNIFINVIFYF